MLVFVSGFEIGVSVVEFVNSEEVEVEVGASVSVEVTVEDSWEGETVVTEPVVTKLASEVLVPTPVPGGDDAVSASVSEVKMVPNEVLVEGWADDVEVVDVATGDSADSLDNLEILVVVPGVPEELGEKGMVTVSVVVSTVVLDTSLLGPGPVSIPTTLIMSDGHQLELRNVPELVETGVAVVEVNGDACEDTRVDDADGDSAAESLVSGAEVEDVTGIDEDSGIIGAIEQCQTKQFT